LVFTVKAAQGPIARDVHTLMTVMKALLVPYLFELDPTVPPILFRDKVRFQSDFSWFSACLKHFSMSKRNLLKINTLYRSQKVSTQFWYFGTILISLVSD